MDLAKKNELRYHYFKKIKRAYELYDFSDLFDDLAENCGWSGKIGRNEVIQDLISGVESMKERNFWHKCTLVQVGRSIAPLDYNTASDGRGERVKIALVYDQGEICMIDRSPIQTLFFRMDISEDGKILSYYATLPSGDYQTID